MKRPLALAGSAIALLCAAFFLRGLAAHWAQIRQIPLDGRMVGTFAVAVLLYAATYLTAARSWQLVLRMLSAPLAYRASLRILATSQFAKYLPGNVAHHVGRVVLAQRAGIRADVAVASLAVDTALVVVAAATCAIGALRLVRIALAQHGEALLRNVVIAGAIIFTVGLLVFLLRPVRTRILHALRPLAGVLASGHRRAAAEAYLQYLLNFALGAAALGVLLTALAGAHAVPWSGLVGVYAIAWLVGFLVPGAPAGIGIRESLLAVGLAPTLGSGVAVAAIALFRLATVFGDGLVFATGLLPGRLASTPHTKIDDA